MDHRGGVEQLHFDVPLISTRRSASANASKSSRNQDVDDYMDTSRSVPFSWEAAPGVPKGSATRTYSNDRKRRNNADADDKCGSSGDDLVVVLDRVSLSESPDVVACRLGPGGATPTRAPSFIMSRFLPAANALAAASVEKYSQPITPPPCSREQQLAMLRRRRPFPSSGCGLVELFPRSLKSVACRFKSPVRCQTPKIATLEASIAQRSRRMISAGDGDGLSSEDGLSSTKACKSPGWGLPLPDTGGVRVRGARLVDGKEESRDGRRRRRRRTPRITTTTSGAGRPLPMLKSPTEPWLARAVNSANRGY